MNRSERGNIGRWIAVVGLVIGVAGGVGLGLWSRRPPPAAATPPPTAASPEAIAAYEEALGHIEHGAADKAIASFQRATARDPSFAAAYLRLATTQLFLDSTPARQAFQEALRRRAALDEHDQLVMHAVEPLFVRDPSDWPEAARRLRPLAERYPDDLVILDTLYNAALSAGRFADAQVAAERQITRRPKDHQGWLNKGNVQAYLGDFDGALASFRRCLEIEPTAQFCFEDTVWVQSQLGACEEMTATARRWAAADANSDFPLLYLADALVASGRPLAEARAEMDRNLARTAASVRTLVAARNATWFAVLEGDFEAAERHLDAWEKAAAGAQNMWAHTRVGRMRVGVSLELGKTADAARAAEEFLSHKTIWLMDATIDDVSLYRDATPDMLHVLRVAGKIGPDEVARRRLAWFDELRAKVSDPYLSFLWMHAYPPTVETAEEARAALAALPAGQDIPPFRPLTSREGDIGRTYMLAGRPLDAIRWLRTATASCRAMEAPLEYVHSHLWLGEALETTGDKAAACGAYRKVLDMWEHARPRSVTAEEARKRSRALGCR